MTDGIPGPGQPVFIVMMAATEAELDPLLAAGPVRTAGASALAFLAATGSAAIELDAWWQANVSPAASPVFLAMDEPGLESWIPGAHGRWFIGVADGVRTEVFSRLEEEVQCVVTPSPHLVVQAAVRATAPTSRPGPVAPSVGATVVHESAGRHYATPVPRRPSQPISYDLPARIATPAQLPPIPDPDADSGWRGVAGVLDRGSRHLRDRWFGTARPSGRSAELGRTVNAHRPIVVGFGSRKGGVGKTTHAAAVAASVGEALDGLPDTAALVDGNVTNPDSWALNPPAGTATVRTLVSRLSDGMDPPPEQYALTPRLAIYPESRESEEIYTQAEIDIIAGHFSRRHAFVAVDLPNALPSLTTGGPGAVAAAWLVHCDVIVLPFNADPRARQGLMEYVAAVESDVDLRGTPIVAPYITSANRAISRDPAVQADLAQLRRNEVEVVAVPDDDNALLALLKDLPINRASPALRRAYVDLTAVIVRAAVRGRSQR